MEALVSEAAETDFASHQAFKWFQDSTCWTREMHVFPTAFLHQAPYPVEVGSLSPWHDTLHAKHTSHVSQGGGNDWSTASKDLQGCSTPKSSWPCKKSIFGIDIAMTLPNILGISGRCLTGVLVGALDGFKHTTQLQSCFWVIVWLKFVAFRFVPKTSSRACSCGCRILPSSATCRGWCRSLQHKWSWCAIPGAAGHWAWLPAWCFWVLSVNLVNGCRCIRQRIWKSKAQSNQRQKALQTWWRAYLDQPVVFGNAWPFQSYLSCCSYEQLVLFGFQSIGGVLSTRWCLKTSSDLLSWSLSLLVQLYSFPFWMPSWSSTLVLFVYKLREKITLWCHEKYMRAQDMIFYKANKVGKKIENCDHQITSDVERFSEVFAEVFSQSLKPIVDFLVYSVELSRVTGPHHTTHIVLLVCPCFLHLCCDTAALWRASCNRAETWRKLSWEAFRAYHELWANCIFGRGTPWKRKS